MVILASASDIKVKQAVLTNFVEASQWKDYWIAAICNDITKILSD
jgi:hypothetical protein